MPSVEQVSHPQAYTPCDARTASCATIESQSSQSEKSANLVTWTTHDDPDHPRNWSSLSKWITLTIVSLTLFVTSASSTILAPARAELGQDLTIPANGAVVSLTMSIFLLGGGAGSLVLGPLSEVHGRVPVILGSNIFFLVFNVLGGFSGDAAQLVVFRFLAGLGGAAPYSLGGGVMGDCFPAERRGYSLSLFSIIPLLGPAAGPIAGAFITKYASWRWAMHAVSIADAVILVVGARFLRESWAPKVLERKRSELSLQTGNKELFTDFDGTHGSFRKALQEALSRPFKLLVTEPIMQALAIYLGFISGVSFMLLSTFDTLWTDQYQLDAAEGSLHYIALAAGYTIGCQICAHTNDRIFQYLRIRHNGPGKPEYRIPMMFAGALLSPAGIFIYGWGAQTHAHWLVPDLGGFLFAVGLDISTQSVTTYIVDCYTHHAASAVAAVAVVRYSFAAIFPLFGPAVYRDLDYGPGSAMLGAISIALGWPAVVLLWRYADRLRARSRYARISDAERETSGTVIVAAVRK